MSQYEVALFERCCNEIHLDLISLIRVYETWWTYNGSYL